MPLIRITASNSSKHTPKSIAKHQLYKSTGILPKKIQESKKDTRTNTSGTKKAEYQITGFNDLELYPQFNISLEGESEDEIIEDEEIEDEDLDESSNIIKAIKFLLDNRYDPNIPKIAKGVITKNFKEKIISKREMYPPLIIKNQLYSLFVNQVTKVDKEIENAILKGQLMKLLINHIHFNDNLIVLKRDYIRILDSKSTGKGDDDFTKFKKLILENNGISMVNEHDLQNYGISQTSNLVNHGFLNYTQDQRDYYISLPNLGNFLNNLNQASLFINQTIQRSKFKQILEKPLIDKWETNYNNWYKFYGLNLKFILSVNYGMGFIENFNTSVGNGWKLA